MKKTVRLSVFLLALMVLLSCSVSSVVATAPPERVSADGSATAQTDSESWNVPEWAQGLEKTVKPWGGSFLYWAEISLDPVPELTYDTGLGMTFLSYKLSVPCKIADLYWTHYTSFCLSENVELLAKANSMEAIWNKTLWGSSIGDYLSDETITKLQAGDYDASEALQLIKETAEYDKSDSALPGLRRQVTYQFDHIVSCTERVKQSLYDLGHQPLSDDLTPAQVLSAAREFVEENPELEVLDEVRELARSGVTSKALATFQSADSKELERFWEATVKVAKMHWSADLRWQMMENLRIAVPCPEAAYTGAVEVPAFEVPGTTLPVSATVGY